jgi:hypothetical protein
LTPAPTIATRRPRACSSATLGVFVLGQDLGEDLLDAEFASDGLGDRPGIPSDHHVSAPEPVTEETQQVDLADAGSAFGGDQGVAGPAHSWARRTAPEHGELVAQDEDLDLLGCIGSGVQHHPTQELGQHQIDQPQRHRRIMPGPVSDELARHGLCSRFRAPTGYRSR